MVRHLRPRPHQRHIPFEHVEELGQFVQAELADQAAEPRFAGVALGGPARFLFGVDPHGAELVHHKGALVQADALLLEDHRPRTGQLDPDGRSQHDGAGEHDEDQAAHDVQPAFERRVEQVVEGGLPHVDELALVQHVDGGPGGQIIAVKRHHGDAGAVLVAGGKGARQQRDLLRFQRHHHLVDGRALQAGIQPGVIPQIRHAETRFLHGGQVAVHHKTVVGVVLQRAQIQRRRLAAAHQQDMAQPQPPAAARPVVPAADQPLGHHSRRAQAVEQPQHHAGIIVQVHEVKDKNKHQDAAAVDDGDAGAPFRQAAQPGVAVNAGHPVAEHQQQRRDRPGRHVARVAGYIQRGARAARLKEADIIETQVVGQQKRGKQQRRVQQRADYAFVALVFFQHRRCPPSSSCRRAPARPALFLEGPRAIV